MMYFIFYQSTGQLHDCQEEWSLGSEDPATSRSYGDDAESFNDNFFVVSLEDLLQNPKRLASLKYLAREHGKALLSAILELKHKEA